MYRRLSITACLSAALVAGKVEAQIIPDQVDPALLTRSLPPIAHDDAAARANIQPTNTPPDASHVTIAAGNVTATQIVVYGAEGIPGTDLTAATLSYLNRPLDQAELSRLAGAIADVARARGLVFASASIAPQPLAGGILYVTLDEGRIDAVRTIGQSNAAADRILAQLVTHRAVTRAELERAVLLVGDLPGIRVQNTQYLRQDGFGILLVTVASDRAMVYGQIDNRGTSEIGRLRATALANLRGGLATGDEIGIVAATTPEHPQQFAFVSGRYVAPLGLAGGVVSITGYYGRTHAGADLGSLDLIGHSYGGAIGYSMPILRSPRSNLWFDTDLRTLVSDQSVLGSRFRRDDITALSGTLRSAGTIAGGAYHANVVATWGIPLPGMTHAGDPLASRPDGDARFVTGSIQADWTHALSGPFSVALSTVAQVASRPLLATAQISLGGPAFGRAYDYSERTGDDGVLGSAELRVDLQQAHLPLVQRAQLYGFADGGVVSNLRYEYGAGSLASTGAGIRAGIGPFDSGFEVAIPLNRNRFDTGDRFARLSFQLSAHI